MKLQHLFAVLPDFTDEISPLLETSGLFNDARQVQRGGVFIAVKGVKNDGHDFISQAIAKGAVALVVTSRAKIPADFHGVVVEVKDIRLAIDLLAARFYGEPGRELFCVGVTGTNGKTSTTYLVEEILNSGQKPTGVIGTVNHHLGETIWPSEMTTPDPLFLQKRLREFRDAGAEAVAFEVSSHALDQKRADSVPYNAVVFTNLTRDHLDYHSTMKDYFLSKQRLFLELLARTGKRPCYAIINIDDEWGRRIHVADHAVLWTYGTREADFRWTIKVREFTRTVFQIETPVGKAEIDLPMGGDHNVQNATAAVAVGVAAGLSLSTIATALSHFSGVPGRLQSVPNQNDLSVFVDYAHTPDALDNVLGSLEKIRRQMKTAAKIWTVFGCGGDRDKGKRPLMLQSAMKISDHVIVTSDNPRTEDPEVIVKDILAGVPAESPPVDAPANRAPVAGAAPNIGRVAAIVDRRNSMRFALSNAAKGDVVLIAGKGHEDYQIIGTEKRPFDDAKIAAEILQELARGS